MALRQLASVTGRADVPPTGASLAVFLMQGLNKSASSGDAGEDLPAPIDTEEAARRLARVIVSDIQLYNGAQIAAGEDISPQIKEGMHHFVSRVAPALQDVFEKVLTERGLRGPVPKSAPPPRPAPSELKRAAAAEAPTPLELPAARTVSPPPAQVDRWDQGAEPERATPRVVSIPPIEPDPVLAAAPTPVPPQPERPTARSIPVKPDQAGPPPIPRAAAAAPKATAPPAHKSAVSRPPAFERREDVSTAAEHVRNDSPVRSPSPISPVPAPPHHQASPQPAYPVTFAASEQVQAPDGPVPNLKPPFPWIRLTLFVGTVAAAVAGLMVMVKR